MLARNPEADILVTWFVEVATNHYFGNISHEIIGSGVRCALLNYQPNIRQPWHTHELPSVFFVLAGGHFDEYKSAQEWQPSDTGLYRPSDARHRAETGPQGVIGLAIEFSPQVADCTPKEYGIFKLPKNSFLPHLVGESLLLRDESNEDAQSYLDELLLLCQSVEATPEVSSPKWLDDALHYIHAHLSEKLSLQKTALECGIHPIHLSRTFTSRFGVSYSEYVRQQRLRKALHLMTDHHCTVGNAAHEAGFYDHAHFCRVWRTTFKSRPDFWRSIVSKQISNC